MALSPDDASRLLGDSRLHAAMQRFYSELEAELAAFAPVCWNRGLCCRFGQAGHSLFVTSMELLYFAGRALASGVGPVPAETTDRRCPYQIDGRCSVREFRPMGCRIYFCQASSAWWQPATSERWLRRLRELHERFGVAYAYVEWLTGLRLIGQLLGDRRPAVGAEVVGR